MRLPRVIGLALRRHHKFRMRDRAASLMKQNLLSDPTDDEIAARGDTYTWCSCQLCGNPRKTRSWRPDGLTVSEYRAALDFEQQVRELEGQL